MTRLVVAAMVLAAMPAPAFAHAPIQGIGTFYNGLLHPLLVPAHLLILLGLGLLLGQQALPQSRWGWGAFVVAFLGGLAGAQVVALPLPQSALLAIALALGLLIAIGRPLKQPQTVLLSGLCGLAVGLDSPAGPSAMVDVLPAAAGTALGGILLLSYVGGLAARPTRSWQRIGVRIAGSWTAAAAGIVLAFLVAGPNAAGGS